MKPEKFEAVCAGTTIRVHVSVEGLDVIVIVSRAAIEDMYRVLSLSDGGTACLNIGHVPERANVFLDPRASHIVIDADVEGLKHIKKVFKEALEAVPLEIEPQVEHTEVIWRDKEGKVYSRQGISGTVEIDDRMKKKLLDLY